MKKVLKIYHDHDALTIMDMINDLIKDYRIQFKSDEKSHDGWEEYTLEEIGNDN